MRPRTFIGSSGESLNIAFQVQSTLEAETIGQVWNQGVFGLGATTWDSLMEEAEQCDFAIFVMSPDDLTISRSVEQHSTRDNVIFEIGLFMGKVGAKRTFILYDKTGDVKLLSDLRGMTFAPYDGKQAIIDPAPTIGVACHPIRQAIHTLGLRERPLPQNDVQIRHFTAPPGERYDPDFYKYFCTKIDAAKDSIYITGDGFSFTGTTGKDLANKFNKSIDNALKRGVKVVRVQTEKKTNQEWISMLSDMKQSYPDDFELYVHRDDNVVHMSSVCVIDSIHPTKNVVEIMLSTRRPVGTTVANVANTAVFIEGKKELADAMLERICSLTSETISTKANTCGEVAELLAP